MDSSLNTALKIFLPAYLIILFLTAFLWRSIVVWKKTGVNPYKLGRSQSAHDLVGFLFRFTFITLAAVIAVFCFSSEAYQYLTPIVWLQKSALAWIGLVLLVISLVWILIAQAQMRESWRIGIDREIKTALVHRGVFRVSRNPIFLGMRVMMVGFFLTLPNAVTLALLLVGDALIQIQVRLEEEHLARMHGEAYCEYQRKTRRWI
ncbi:MAG TPA: isoprenylcysteine carboxylmethyltransferase family protein [Blastocatellia bacterium]|jgi:protein-S-isoprenylcysteine O-methyltransferase Ste14